APYCRHRKRSTRHCGTRRHLHLSRCPAASRAQACHGPPGRNLRHCTSGSSGQGSHRAIPCEPASSFQPDAGATWPRGTARQPLLNASCPAAVSVAQKGSTAPEERRIESMGAYSYSGIVYSAMEFQMVHQHAGQEEMMLPFPDFGDVQDNDTAFHIAMCAITHGDVAWGYEVLVRLRE